MVRSHSAGRVIAVCVGLAILHSLLASRLVKQRVEYLVGSRAYQGTYRLGFNLQSLITVGLATLWFLRLPDRELYRLRGAWACLLRGVQFCSLGMLFAAVRVVGFGRFLGVSQCIAMLRGKRPLDTPEAQGPPLIPTAELDARGPFRITRHPDNLPVFGTLWCFPRMTVNRLALATVLSIYAILGSHHEDHRLRAAYGAAFERYAKRVPFMLPRLSIMRFGVSKLNHRR
jgi:methanethiol S-methyltransferase